MHTRQGKCSHAPNYSGMMLRRTIPLPFRVFCHHVARAPSPENLFLSFTPPQPVSSLFNLLDVFCVPVVASSFLFLSLPLSLVPGCFFTVVSPHSRPRKQRSFRRRAAFLKAAQLHRLFRAPQCPPPKPRCLSPLPSRSEALRPRDRGQGPTLIADRSLWQRPYCTVLTGHGSAVATTAQE